LIVIGLTGSIGMGKTTVAQCFIELGINVFEADKEVHRALAEVPEVISKLKKRFPECFKTKIMDRNCLATMAFKNESVLNQLESVLHPHVINEIDNFISKKKAEGELIIVIEAPLLFECGIDVKCDYIIVANAKAPIQKERVLKRPGMNASQLEFLLSRQVFQEDKLLKADYIINTDLDLASVHKEAKKILNILTPTTFET